MNNNDKVTTDTTVTESTASTATNTITRIDDTNANAVKHTSKRNDKPASHSREGITFSKSVGRSLVRGAFGFWHAISVRCARAMGWYPRLDPYIGYGTESFVRIICRSVYGPAGHGIRKNIGRGIRNIFLVPAERVPVTMHIDTAPIISAQVGDPSLFDEVGQLPESHADSIVTDKHGYLDIISKCALTPGEHTVTYSVPNRSHVTAPLFITSQSAQVGIISDVDDTIMVSQVPSIFQASLKFLFANPHKRSSVPGMSVFYNKIADLFPDAPFFYLSTSPWNVEGSIRELIRRHGFPQGPTLLRDIDPKPQTFIPSGVEHKLEFVEQIMADFPDTRFILIGDDGQQDPSTYARIAHMYPGRIIAIGIRRLAKDEKRLQQLLSPINMPDIEVPVFYGQSGVNLMSTMYPFLSTIAKNLAHKNDVISDTNDDDSRGK